MSDDQRTVLVVEDDPHIRLMLSDDLADAGYLVIEAGNVLEAIAILGTCAGIAALVTDVDMPGPLNGIHLATMAGRIFPRMEVIITSGRDIRSEVPSAATFFPKPLPFSILADHLGRRFDVIAAAPRSGTTAHSSSMSRRHSFAMKGAR